MGRDYGRYLKKPKKWRDQILDLIFFYDPGYLNFFYSLKTLLSCVLSIALTSYFFHDLLIMWAALIPIHFHFLNATSLHQNHTLRNFLLFLAFSLFDIFVLYLSVPHGYFMMLPLGLLGFVSILSSKYDADLQKVMNMSIINGLIVCIYERLSPNFKLSECVIILIMAGGICILMHNLNFRQKHGRIARKHFPSLFHTMRLMVKNLHRQKEFMKFHQQVNAKMDFLRLICDPKLSRVNDSQAIKSAKRAIFYIYRAEEIYQCISALCDDPFVHHKDFIPMRREIIYNLNQLSLLFEGKNPHLKKLALTPYEGQSSPFINTIKVLYNKMELFRRSEEEHDFLAQPGEKKSLKIILKSITWRDATFRYGIKYAVVLMLSVMVSEFFHIMHGAWITMACVAISKPSLGGVNRMIKDYAIGGVIGIVLGTFLAYLTYPDRLFYTCFVVTIFGFIYFRTYPYKLWICFVMMAFVMMFSAIYGVSYEIVTERLMDIGIAFLLDFIVFWILWPRYSGSEIIPNFKKILKNLLDSMQLLIDYLNGSLHQDQLFKQNQKEFFEDYNAFLLCIEESRNEKRTQLFHIKDLRKSLKYINFLNQSTLKLYYFLQERAKMSSKEFYINDIKLIQTRYEMTIRALNQANFYLKEQKDGRLLGDDKDFNEIIDQMFEAQNSLFISLKIK